MKSAARKTERADEHTEQSGETVIEGKDSPEAPEERTITFQAIRGDDDGPAAAAPAAAAPADAPASTAAESAAAGSVDAESTDIESADASASEDSSGRPAAALAPSTVDADDPTAATADVQDPVHAGDVPGAEDVQTPDAEGADGADDAGDVRNLDDVEGADNAAAVQNADEADNANNAGEGDGAEPADGPGDLGNDDSGDPGNDDLGNAEALRNHEDAEDAEGSETAEGPGAAEDAESAEGAGGVAGVGGAADDAGGLQPVEDIWHARVTPAGDDAATDVPEAAPTSDPAAGSLFQPARSAATAEARSVWEAHADASSVPATLAQPESPTGWADHPEADPGPDAQHDPYNRVREVALPKPVSRALTAALAGLRDAVSGVRLGLEVPGVEEARKAQAEILAQIKNYVIPRVHMSTAPALIAVAGSTGAGKSTLVNTLAAAKVSATGVRRPTTGTPVLVCHPDDGEWFAKGDVLSGLVRLDRPAPGSGLDSLVLATSERLPPATALLDTPDIDSVVETHHEVAQRMMDAADLWIFVTTATRYADAPAWNLLRLAKERGARMAIVLSRVPPKSRDVIDKHFARMLQEYGLGEIDRFVVNEVAVTAGRLPEEEVADLRMWLTELSVDDQRRDQAVRATLEGVLNSFRGRVPALARHMEAQVALRAELRTDVDAAYMGALAEIDDAMSSGSLLRGEVLARWQDFAGSGDLMKTLHLRRPGRLATKTAQQAPARLHAFRSALRSGLEAVIVSAGQRAAEEVIARWRQRDGAGDRLAETPGLGRPSDEFARRVGRTIGAWQEHVIGLIRSGGVTKRTVAKLVAFDEEALSMVFMMGLLGYGSSEVAAVSGTGTLPERLLRGVLGAEALRNIGTKARSDLRARISVLFDEETFRYVQVLDEAGIPDEAAAKRLYQATYNLEVAR
ncbi:AAA family ATPase [Sphaerisporangium sp. NPDC004334]